MPAIEGNLARLTADRDITQTRARELVHTKPIVAVSETGLPQGPWCLPKKHKKAVQHCSTAQLSDPVLTLLSSTRVLSEAAWTLAW
jgi:hypothetical protein